MSDESVRLEVLQAQLDAHRAILFGLLRALHEADVLALPAVIERLRSSAAFGQGAFDTPPPPTLAPMIEALQALADAYAKRAPPR